MIHHKVLVHEKLKIPIVYKGLIGKPYGVSSSHKVLTKGLLIKKFDLIRDCLAQLCELTPAERDVTLELLRFQAYYPQVYPKARQVASDTGRGVATFWRTVLKLRDMNLLKVVNRYLIRPEAQISNLYLLDGLIILIAKYLAEHIGHIWPDWLWPYLHLTWPAWWSALETGQRKLPLLREEAAALTS